MTSPVLRSFPAFGYDPVANALVLYGGVDSNLGTYLNDTWKFPLTGTVWAALTPTTNPTLARSQMGFGYDSTRHKFLMWGGRGLSTVPTETESLDVAGNTWATVATANPGGRQLAAMAYQAGRDRIVLFGGQDTQVSGTVFSETWEYDPSINSWSQKLPSTVPAARVWHSIAYNPSNGLIYMVGGASTTTGTPTFRTDTWSWDGTNWTLINNTLPGTGLAGFAVEQSLSYSSANSTMMYVAADGAGSVNTYLLVGSSWVQQTPAHSPLVEDIFQSLVPDGPGVALLGMNSAGTLSVPWHWSGTDWSDLTAGIPVPPVPTQPPIQPPRSGAYHVYQTTPPDSGGVSTTALMNPAGLALEGALGDLKDYLADKAKMAAQVGMPLQAPSDALPKIGLGRQIPRGINESDASYAARLQGAWSTWPFAGTAFGLLTAFSQTGYPNVVLAQPNGSTFYSLDGSGNLIVNKGVSWTPSFVGDPFWSRFDVIFPSPLPASWVSGGVPASNSDESNLIRLLISYWKPAYATCNRIIIITAGSVWDFPGTDLWNASGDTWNTTDATTVWTP